jgi:hypothetical protein
MRQKSKITIKQASFQAYKSVTDIFYGYEIHKIVKIITGRRGIYTDSTLRKLRVLRKEGKINYRILKEKADSLYIKVL